MRNIFKRSLVLSLLPLILVALVWCGGSFAATTSGGVTTLIAAHVLDTEHPVHKGYVEMDRVLREVSGGTMVLEIFANSSLGDEIPTLEALRVGGSIDLTAPSGASVQPFAKEFAMCDFPYGFANYDQVWKFYDGEAGAYLFAKSELSGLRGLSWWDNGFRNFTTTDKEIHVPADMAGMKIRTMNAPVHMAIVNALGAAATPVPYAEVYSALQQGVVDGEENPVANIFGSKFQEVQKYLIMDRHVHDPSPSFISSKTWAQFTPEQQGWVQQAADQAATHMRQVSIDEEEAKKDLLRQAGMTIIDLKPEELKLFQDATKDVYKQFIEEIGQEAIDIYLKCLEESRK